MLKQGSLKATFLAIYLFFYGSGVCASDEVMRSGETIQSPKSTAELLQNIKFCLSRNLFLEDSTYVELTLRKILGAERILMVKNEPGGDMIVEFDGFNGLAPPVHYEKMTLNGIDVSLRRTKATRGDMAARLMVNFRRPQNIGVEAVAKIFGGRLERLPDPPDPHRRIKPSLGQDSNSTFVLKMFNGHIRQTVTVKTDERSNINRMIVLEETAAN